MRDIPQPGFPVIPWPPSHRPATLREVEGILYGLDALGMIDGFWTSVFAFLVTACMHVGVAILALQLETRWNLNPFI